MCLCRQRRQAVRCHAQGIGHHIVPAFGVGLYGPALSVVEGAVFRGMSGQELLALNQYTSVSTPVQNLAGSVEPACISACRRSQSTDMFAGISLGVGVLATVGVWLVSRSMQLDACIQAYFCLRMCSFPTYTLYNTCTAKLKFERRLGALLRAMAAAFCFYAGLLGAASTHLATTTPCGGRLDLVTLGVCQSASELFYLGLLLRETGVRPKVPDWPFFCDAVHNISAVSMNNLNVSALSMVRAKAAQCLGMMDQAAHQLCLMLLSSTAVFGKLWTVLSQCVLPTSGDRPKDTAMIVLGIHVSGVALFGGVLGLCTHAPGALTALPEVQAVIHEGAWTLAAYIAVHDAGRGLVGVLSTLERFQELFYIKGASLGVLCLMLYVGPKTLAGAWGALMASAAVNYVLVMAAVVWCQWQKT